MSCKPTERALAMYLLTAAWCLAAPADSAPDFFETRIRPVLAKNCYACHTGSRMGGLRLDSREHLLKGGAEGPVVVPGDAEKSLLIQAVRQTHARLKMPPGGKLAPREVEDLVSWINAGVVWPESPAPVPSGPEYVIRPDQRAFWAFQPVRAAKIPDVRDTRWPQNAIDRFILARLEENGLHPVDRASKMALIRRATFDLTGLPPTPEEVDRFVADSSPRAFAAVIDRLLASPHYGERWGRHWLDLARYSDGDLGASKDEPFLNAWRYRDWVIQSFNEDLPYDVFVKAQIAADRMPAAQREKLLPGLGFYSIGPGDDDRVDVTGQVFLGLTIGCAKCHDHKYDPVPTRDFYSLLGIFKSSKNDEYPLAPAPEVDAYKKRKKEIEEQKYAIDDFVLKHGTELSEILAARTSRYLMAAWEVLTGLQKDACNAARQHALDDVILDRWVEYLRTPGHEHKFLDRWDRLLASRAAREQVQQAADEFQALVVAVFNERHAMEDRNYVKLGGAAGVRVESIRQYTNLESLPIEKFYLWRDLASDPYRKDFFIFRGGVYYFGVKDIDRFLAPILREHLDGMRERLAGLKREQPVHYPFLHVLKDAEKPADEKVHIRGDESNLGEAAPRRFRAILCDGEPARFTTGSGRLELAEAIASPRNPLFARVMVNRIWQHHFGYGLVRTPSNFGQLGERPTHPELLDYLASRFVESGWSVKAMHREIMLSAAYQMSTNHDEAAFAADPANRLLWRANLRQRLEAESLRDAMLSVSGKLDTATGGPPKPLDDENCRRAVYGLIGRTKLDATLALFDFPNPNFTSEQRMATVGPMQRLYFLNSSFVALQAKALAQRLETAGPGAAERIRYAYRLLYGRPPSEEEVRMGEEFLGRGSWPQYTQVLLGSAEFSAVN